MTQRCSIRLPLNVLLCFVTCVNGPLKRGSVSDCVSCISAFAPVPNVEMKFQCPECLAQFHAWLDLVSHVAQHGVVAGSDNKQANVRDRDAHKCELCYKSFTSEERLQVHRTTFNFRVRPWR